MVDNEENSILIRIRGKLNEGKIKLWLEPYYSKNNMVEAEMQVSKISFVHILYIFVHQIIEILISTETC